MFHRSSSTARSLSLIWRRLLLVVPILAAAANALRVPLQGYQIILSPTDSGQFLYSDAQAVKQLAEQAFVRRLVNVNFGTQVQFESANFETIDSVFRSGTSSYLFFGHGGHVEFEVDSLESLPSQTYIQQLLEDTIANDLLPALTQSDIYNYITQVTYRYDPEPTVSPTQMPSFRPSIEPTPAPSPTPSVSPTLTPTTKRPTTSPTPDPTLSPTTASPTLVPTKTLEPSHPPSASPTMKPADVTFDFDSNTINNIGTRTTTNSSSPNATITTVAVVAGGLAMSVLILSLLVAKRKRDIRTQKYLTESIQKAHHFGGPEGGGGSDPGALDHKSDAGSSGISSLLRAVTSGRLPVIMEEESPSVCTSSDETPDVLSDVDLQHNSPPQARMLDVEMEDPQQSQQQQQHNYGADDLFSSGVTEVEPNIIPLSSFEGSPDSVGSGGAAAAAGSHHGIIPIDVGFEGMATHLATLDEDKHSHASSSSCGGAGTNKICGFIPRFPFWSTTPSPSTAFPTSQSLSGQVQHHGPSSPELQQQQQQLQYPPHHHSYYPSNVSASALGEKDGFEKWSDKSSTDGEFQNLEDGLDYPMGSGSDFWDPHEDDNEYGGLRVLDPFERPPRDTPSASQPPPNGGTFV
eukprot:CAMPEP_0195285782 /NCGR_PEP_ID=MMETSP0707-20130614/3494_1 /TAXON_ID=33640 /ORGANISM="Asterionellopsis glacialis, Strain CCMP134" /LENGTH=631 /DNA_ID=CAMNT_0040345331 /DNA_START=34 /DNA_END=1929 /DNA_ORIENTATION=+